MSWSATNPNLCQDEQSFHRSPIPIHIRNAWRHWCCARKTCLFRDIVPPFILSNIYSNSVGQERCHRTAVQCVWCNLRTFRTETGLPRPDACNALRRASRDTRVRLTTCTASSLAGDIWPRIMEDELRLAARKVEQHLCKVAVCPRKPLPGVGSRVVDIDGLVDQS